jgi:hypothetical protein
MTWSELRKQLDEAMQALEAQGRHGLYGWLRQWPAGEGAERFLEAEFLHEREIERAIKGWSRGKPLPILEETPRTFLWIRFDFAAQLVRAFAQADPGNASAILGNGQEARRWALLSAWELAGFEAIHGTIESLPPAPPPGKAGKN